MFADKENRFDRYVRSVMQDAEEKVPSGVWKAVSGRIATSRETRPVWLWWPALAAAAVACAVILLAPLRQTLPVREDGIRLVQLVSSEQELVIAQLLPPCGITQGKVMEIPSVKEETVLPEEREEMEDESPVAEIPSAQENAQEWRWKEIVQEDSERPLQTGRPLSVKIGGSFGANDSGIYGFAAMPSYSDVPRAGTINEESVSVYSVPVSFALGVRVPLGNKFYVSTGLSYTMLSRTFKGAYKTESGDITHKLQYIGIPVDINYSFFDSKRLSVYAIAGIEAEKCIADRYWFYAKSPSPVYQQDVKGIQLSAGLGIGIQYKLSQLLGIYLDPGVRYYFDCNQPKSVRTDKPLTFNIEAGLRFNL